MKTKEQYIHLLSDFHKNRGFVYGINKLGIFGSVARGEQKEGSDVDPVDIVRIRKSMNNLLKKRINKDGLYV